MLEVALVILLIQMHDFLRGAAVHNEEVQVDFKLANEVVAFEDVSIIDLKLEFVALSISFVVTWRLEIEEHPVVERCFAIRASPVRVCLLLVFFVDPCFDEHVTRALHVFHWYVLRSKDAQSQLVVLLRLRRHVPYLLLVTLLEHVEPAEDCALGEARTWMVQLSVLYWLILY